MAEPDPDIHAPPLQAVRGLDAMVLGAQEHFLAASGLLGSFLLRAWVLGMAGHAVGLRVLVLGRHLDMEAAETRREPRVLVRRRRLDAEVAEALHGPRRLQLEVGETARGTMRGSPQWR